MKTINVYIRKTESNGHYDRYLLKVDHNEWLDIVEHMFTSSVTVEGYLSVTQAALDVYLPLFKTPQMALLYSSRASKREREVIKFFLKNCKNKFEIIYENNRI